MKAVIAEVDISRKLDKRPKVSIIMPVFNGEKYLCEAMDSILNQTFKDFEFIIIDDGSTDKTSEIISEYNDNRIQVIKNHTNLGLVNSLNIGIKAAKGEYIARMDCDDISLPSRLGKQVAFLDKHSEIGLCGTWYLSFNESVNDYGKPPANHEHIKAFMLFNNAVIHPPIMMRRKLLLNHNLCYEEEFEYAEDYRFILNCSRHFKLYNMPRMLYKVRVHIGSHSAINDKKLKKTIQNIHKVLLDMFKINYTDEEMRLHLKLSFIKDVKAISKDEFIRIKQWLRKLYIANENNYMYSEPYYSRVIMFYWYEALSRLDSLYPAFTRNIINWIIVRRIFNIFVRISLWIMPERSKRFIRDVLLK